MSFSDEILSLFSWGGWLFQYFWAFVECSVMSLILSHWGSKVKWFILVMKFPSWLAVEQMQSQRERMESAVYDEVSSIGGDGLILSVSVVCRGAGTVVGLCVDRLLLPWAPQYVGSCSYRLLEGDTTFFDFVPKGTHAHSCGLALFLCIYFPFAFLIFT